MYSNSLLRVSTTEKWGKQSSILKLETVLNSFIFSEDGVKDYRPKDIIKKHS